VAGGAVTVNVLPDWLNAAQEKPVPPVMYLLEYIRL